jgi:hypothetical protein
MQVDEFLPPLRLSKQQVTNQVQNGATSITKKIKYKLLTTSFSITHVAWAIKKKGMNFCK